MNDWHCVACGAKGEGNYLDLSKHLESCDSYKRSESPIVCNMLTDSDKLYLAYLMAWAVDRVVAVMGTEKILEYSELREQANFIFKNRPAGEVKE